VEIAEDADASDPEVCKIVQLAPGLWMTTAGRIPMNVAAAHAEAAP
jgi:hypothetical protein